MTQNNTQYHNGGDTPRTAKVVQLRRGTSAQNNAFKGSVGEVTMDTTAKTLRVHDGEKIGGYAMARQSTLDAADYVVEWQNPTDANGFTWYRKYKSGWVEQGGRNAINSASGIATLTVNLPIATTNARSANISYMYSTGDSAVVVSWWQNGTTSITIQVQPLVNGGSVGGYVCWTHRGIAV